MHAHDAAIIKENALTMVDPEFLRRGTYYRGSTNVMGEVPSILIRHCRINNCYTILICDMAENLIAMQKLYLSEVWDSFLTLMHFEIMYNLLISLHIKTVKVLFYKEQKLVINLQQHASTTKQQTWTHLVLFRPSGWFWRLHRGWWDCGNWLQSWYPCTARGPVR